MLVSVRMLKVSDIMTPGVFVLDQDTAADEAAWGLTRRHIGGAPVRDKAGEIVGVLSKSDLVDPQPQQWIKGQATVGDLMTPAVSSVYADDPASVAVHEMARQNVHRLVVLGSDGKTVGIVTTLDVVKALAKGETFRLDDEAGSAKTEGSQI